MARTGQQRLARRLGAADAVVIGLGSMIGAGVFAASPRRRGRPEQAHAVAVAAVVVLAGTADLRGAIGFSSFGVPVYYAIANVSAWTLGPAQGRPPRPIPLVSLAGCLVLAGCAVLAAGAVVYGLRRTLAPRSP
ncbi:hypothetical protein ABT340_25860 [Streptosporangium sp. NPDC000239]|uniref:hypothetical protein n=1 Tax=Streptosporangium sp. NPDC000239 TaxID=3154248 RepID=UPI003323C59B